jgi:hypothetical protein
MSADKKLKVFLDDKEDVLWFDGCPTERSSDVKEI